MTPERIKELKEIYEEEIRRRNACMVVFRNEEFSRELCDAIPELLNEIQALTTERDNFKTTINPDAMQALIEGRAAVVPLEATAENGMKYAMSGEFKQGVMRYDDDNEVVSETIIYWETIKQIVKGFVEKSRLDKVCVSRDGENK